MLGLCYRLCRVFGTGPDRVINVATRSFAAAEGGSPALLTRFRRRPCPALVALLRRRLRRFDPVRLAARSRAGEELTAALPGGLEHPGDGLGRRTHWLYPVLTADPQRLVTELRGRGIDASSATSNLSAVGSMAGSGAGSGAGAAAYAARVLDSVVYLPVYPELTEAARRDLLAGLTAAVEADPCRR